MGQQVSPRLLSIGEFAAATQLTPKALRLYDEQRLLRPAHTDLANGYRYYRSDQVATGRLIRTLRDMDLSLAQIQDVVSKRDAQAESALSALAQECDRRYAAQKRAFQAALMQLRSPAPSRAPQIEVLEQHDHIAAIRSFTADRRRFMERFLAELDAALAAVHAAGLSAGADADCSLIDPLTDEEGRLELALPIQVSHGVPGGLTLRHVPARRYASVALEQPAHAAQFPGALDALFDWFDRHGHRAVDTPIVVLQLAPARHITSIAWAFEPGDSMPEES
jgi:DNA-binding transcriptional MerR regulator